MPKPYVRSPRGEGGNVLKHILLLLFVVILTITAPVLHAAEEDTRETSETTPSEALPGGDKQEKPKAGENQAVLDEVVVTATRLPTPAKELPVPVQVISRKEIAESHADDLAELLTEKLPEHFQKYPGASKDSRPGDWARNSRSAKGYEIVGATCFTGSRFRLGRRRKLG